ncbi:hypothetical protein HDV00_011535 [Rhizophlyctis rosea]|nr:hypothetical protein HDV00_011535 [Rhizophlyctis rosea]
MFSKLLSRSAAPTPQTASPAPPAAEPGPIPKRSERSLTWDFECRFRKVRHELNRSLNTQNAIMFLSEPFGPVESRWRICLQLVRGNNSEPKHFYGKIVAEKTALELAMGDDWSRIVHMLVMTLRHPQQQVDYRREALNSGRCTGAGTSCNWGWREFIPADTLKSYLTHDGSLCVSTNVVWDPADCYSHLSFSPFRSFLMKDFLADVSLLVNSNVKSEGVDDQTQPLPAHKVVLAAGSPYFRALFSSVLTGSSSSSSPPSARTTVDMTDFSLATTHSLLEFIYTNSLSNHQPEDYDSCIELIRAADYFQMKTCTCALGILAEANKYKGICGVLATTVKDYVKNGWEEFVECEEFRESLREHADSIADVYE